MVPYSPIITVSQLCRHIKLLLEEQKNLTDLMVRGEISNLSHHSASGHLYFSLREQDSLIHCIMFSKYAQRLEKLPENGSSAVIRGTAGLYPRDGSFQLVAYDIQVLGQGQHKKRLEQLWEQLRKEGLFAPGAKRALPPFPQAVGVITSPDGAAIEDICKTFAHHNPLVKLVVYPAVVQGSEAPRSILNALEALEMEGVCQTAIIARGGGSSEDLSAFNDEALVRGVYACKVPVISAVGHEVDSTLLDQVADARAATPTAACTLAAQSLASLRGVLDDYTRCLRQAIQEQISCREKESWRLVRLLHANSPYAELKKNGQILEYLVKSLIDAQQNKIQMLEGHLKWQMTRLELLNPISLMLRGYSITLRNGKVVSAPGEVSVGERLLTQISGGIIESVVTNTWEMEEKP